MEYLQTLTVLNAKCRAQQTNKDLLLLNSFRVPLQKANGICRAPSAVMFHHSRYSLIKAQIALQTPFPCCSTLPLLPLTIHQCPQYWI